MDHGIAGIDHVIVGVRDLERARLGWERLGFTLTPRGRHLGQGTANYCIMFARDYLELLGCVEADPYGHRLRQFLERGEGALGPAFALAGPPEAVAAALAARGLHPAPPRALGRQLELPEGTVVPRFSLINLPPEETPGLDTFLCGHLTPELVRRPQWLVHANGVTGLAGIDVSVADPAALVPAYRRLFGDGAVHGDGEAATVEAGPHRIRFVRGAEAGIVALRLTIADRDRAADHLTQWQVPFDDRADGALAIPAAQANGVELILSAA